MRASMLVHRKPRVEMIPMVDQREEDKGKIVFLFRSRLFVVV